MTEKLAQPPQDEQPEKAVVLKPPQPESPPPPSKMRTLRRLLGYVTDPVFDQFHDAKIAAIEKTFAFPAITVVSVGSLPLTVGLILLSLALGVQLLVNGRWSGNDG